MRVFTCMIQSIMHMQSHEQISFALSLSLSLKLISPTKLQNSSASNNTQRNGMRVRGRNHNSRRKGDAEEV